MEFISGLIALTTTTALIFLCVNLYKIHKVQKGLERQINDCYLGSDQPVKEKECDLELEKDRPEDSRVNDDVFIWHGGRGQRLILDRLVFNGNVVEFHKREPEEAAL